MSAHLDLDDLADLLAGEGDDAQVEHVAACTRCSAALVDLEDAQQQVRAALSALPAPQVPADLAARLDAALLAARPPEPAAPRRLRGVPAPLGEDGPGQDGDVRGGTAALPLPRPRPRTSREPSPWLLRGAAAAAVLLALGGAVTLVVRQAGSSADSTAASPAMASAATSGPPALKVSRTGRDYRAGRPALRAALPALLSAPAARPEAAPDADPLASADGQTLPAPAMQAPADPLERLHDPGELAGCLSALAERGTRGAPLAVDYAAYDGRPALVVVLRAPAADRVDVVVVGAGCRAGADATLLSTRLPRP